jgi:phage terminase large subunit GpA-like protein
MTLWVLTAGSATELASRAVRWVFQDEVDKYPISTGREADPCSLVEERARTFKDQARIVRASTPTTKSGRIWPAWERRAADQRTSGYPQRQAPRVSFRRHRLRDALLQSFLE